MQIGDWGERLDARTQHSGIPSVGPSLCQDAKAGKFENLRFLFMVSPFRMQRREHSKTFRVQDPRAGKFENLPFLLIIYSFRMRRRENSKTCVSCSFIFATSIAIPVRNGKLKSHQRVIITLQKKQYIRKSNYGYFFTFLRERARMSGTPQKISKRLIHCQF